MSTLRKGVRAGYYSEHQASETWRALRGFPLVRDSHLPLLARVWKLRDNVSTYDAAYVALAEALDCPLLTADRRLAQAPGLRCAVELLGP
jgi:predicted nucleic acid-binding protein